LESPLNRSSAVGKEATAVYGSISGSVVSQAEMKLGVSEISISDKI
jgi:hypothetical protein